MTNSMYISGVHANSWSGSLEVLANSNNNKMYISNDCVKNVNAMHEQYKLTYIHAYNVYSQYCIFYKYVCVWTHWHQYYIDFHWVVQLSVIFFCFFLIPVFFLSRIPLKSLLLDYLFVVIIHVFRHFVAAAHLRQTKMQIHTSMFTRNIALYFDLGQVGCSHLVDSWRI